MSGYTFDEITKDKPEKSLLAPKKQKAGRNFRGTGASIAAQMQAIDELRHANARLLDAIVQAPEVCWLWTVSIALMSWSGPAA